MELFSILLLFYFQLTSQILLVQAEHASTERPMRRYINVVVLAARGVVYRRRTPGAHLRRVTFFNSSAAATLHFSEVLWRGCEIAAVAANAILACRA